MKKQNKLLKYISVKGSGEIIDFRNVCLDKLEIEEKWYEVLYNFCSLGHVDYFTQSEGWSCSEPSLAVTSKKNEGVLCGARSIELKKKLDEFSNLQIVENNLDGPDVWKVKHENGSFEKLVDKLKGLNFTYESAPKNLIRILPALQKYIKRVREKRKNYPNMEKEPRWWDPNPGERRWVKKKSLKKNGLWLIYDAFSNKPYFIQQVNNSIFEVGDPYAVKFFVDKKPDKLVNYHPEKKEVSVKTLGGGIKLPRLYSRVLTLCSGKLPKKDRSGRLIYSHVPPDIAKAVFIRLSCGSAFNARKKDNQ